MWEHGDAVKNALTALALEKVTRQCVNRLGVLKEKQDSVTIRKAFRSNLNIEKKTKKDNKGKF